MTVGLEKYIYFPPGVDFSKFLGERGIGRGFASADDDENNVGGWVALESEDELDALEKEDDMLDAEIVGMDDEGSVGGEVDRPLVIGQSSSPFRKRGANGLDQEAPSIKHDPVDMVLSPATPSADAREVEAAMDPGDDDDVAEMDVSKDEEPAKSAKSPTPVEKNKELKGEGSKKYVLHAIEITKPPSFRQSKVRAVRDDENDDMEMEKTPERRSSRLGKGKTKESPSPKRVAATKKGKGKAIDVNQSEENDGGRSRGRTRKPAERPAGKVAGSSSQGTPKKGKAKKVSSTPDGKNSASKVRSDSETEEDEGDDVVA